MTNGSKKHNTQISDLNSGYTPYDMESKTVPCPYARLIVGTRHCRVLISYFWKILSYGSGFCRASAISSPTVTDLQI